MEDIEHDVRCERMEKCFWDCNLLSPANVPNNVFCSRMQVVRVVEIMPTVTAGLEGSFDLRSEPAPDPLQRESRSKRDKIEVHEGELLAAWRNA